MKNLQISKLHLRVELICSCPISGQRQYFRVINDHQHLGFPLGEFNKLSFKVPSITLSPPLQIPKYPYRFEKKLKQLGICPVCKNAQLFRYYEDLEGNNMSESSKLSFSIKSPSL
jgi:hypothetical protein